MPQEGKDAERTHSRQSAVLLVEPSASDLQHPVIALAAQPRHLLSCSKQFPHLQETASGKRACFKGPCIDTMLFEWKNGMEENMTKIRNMLPKHSLKMYLRRVADVANL